MTERAFHGAGAVAVELVGHRPRHRPTRGDGLREQLVDVLHVQHEADGRAAVVLRASGVHLGRLVGEHDGRVPDLDLRVAHLSAGRGHAHHLDGAEGALIEIDGARAIVDDQVGCGGVVSVGNRLHFLGHGVVLSSPSDR